MAVKYVCDGTGKVFDSKGDLKEIGPLGRVYCADAVPDVEAYIAERDELHDKAAKVWQAGLTKIRKKYDKIAVLPDA